MLPIETKLSIPTERLSLQNTALPDGNQLQTCLRTSNLNKHTASKQYRHRNVNYHIPSASIHEYTAPFQSEWNINNKMIPFGYYLQFGQYENKNNGNLHQVPPFSVSLNPSFTSSVPNVSAPTFNGGSMTPATAKVQFSEFNSSLGGRPLLTYSMQKTEYENLSQPCCATHQQQMMSPSFSLSKPLLSSITTSVSPPARTMRKYNKRVHRPPVEQQLAQFPNNSTGSIFSNCWSSLPLPSMADTIVSPNECTSSVDLIRASNFVPLSLPDSPISPGSPSAIISSKSNSRTVQQHSLPHSTASTFERHQISGQCLSDQRYSHMQKPINNCSSSNLSYNLPYFLTSPQEPYYMLSSNPMSINLPTVPCSTLLPELNTTFSPLSFSNNMKKVRKKRSGPRKSEVVQNPTAEVPMDEKNMVPTPLIPKIPLLRRRLQKKPKVKDNRIKALISRMKQKNKLAVLKFMIAKRKRQQQQQQHQLSKKKLSEIKIETAVPEMVDSNVSKIVEMETKLPDIIAPSLKITFNAAQKIEAISLYYHQRHKPEIETANSLTPSNNKLGLLIEAVNFIEMYNVSPKLALESIE